MINGSSNSIYATPKSSRSRQQWSDIATLYDVEHTTLYWLFRLPAGANPYAALHLAKQRFECRYPNMVFAPLLSPALHKELGGEGQLAEGLEGREIALILNIMR
ncbi:MAG: hypothetical protein R3293_26230 [Candidatus Promineifilaceae bacterium]|nr:hypothetical protein [Candidatus Promineifilaceae bacterium]